MKFLLMLSALALGSSSSEIYSFKAKSIDAVERSLAEYQGKVLLIVNTASECGYTPQYAALQKLFQKYKDQGFVVLGFPSNDFGGQEPGTNAQIKFFCKTNYSVDFPMFEKGSVSGKGAQPLFAWLTHQAADQGEIKWNFEKFLVARDGKTVVRFRSSVKPDSRELVSKIEAALSTPARGR